MNELRTLRGTFQPAQARNVTLGGRQYLSVPVVALVGGVVIRPHGSLGPEYVPTEVLARSAPAWARRPTTTDHPMRAGQAISVEEPGAADRWAVGQISNARMLGNRLLVDALVDMERAATMGGRALDLLDRILRKEKVEVSIGAMVRADAVQGRSPAGEAYAFIWRDIAPDHLALLPKGATGACSISMGCGVRAAADRMTVNCASESCNCQRKDATMAHTYDLYMNPPDPWALAIAKRDGTAQAEPPEEETADLDIYMNPPDPWALAIAKREAGQ